MPYVCLLHGLPPGRGGGEGARPAGTLRRLVSAPVNRVALLVGKALPFVFLATFQLIFVLLVCNLLFDVPLGNSPLAIGLIVLASGLVVAGMGIMVAALARNATQAGVVAILIVLVMAAISGCLMPK